MSTSPNGWCPAQHMACRARRIQPTHHDEAARRVRTMRADPSHESKTSTENVVPNKVQNTSLPFTDVKTWVSFSRSITVRPRLRLGD